MNQEKFEAGKAAYQQGDILSAAQLLAEAKDPGEVSGAIEHMLANCMMRLNRFDDAARDYADALHDASYGHKGALSCNRGRALLAAGRPQEAVAALVVATKDESYRTPYKAYTALGNANRALGNIRDAAVAFRSAAIDEANPNPSRALQDLGGCFLSLGRAVDAVEAYRTALDFAAASDEKSAIYADLGLAYVAANRMSEAVDSFGHALATPGFTLRPEAQAAYEAARKSVDAADGGDPSETDAFLAAAGYAGANAIDPLDPTGKTGEVMPSPEDTGFFSISEEDIVAQAKRERKARRKHGHRGLRVFLVILILLVLAAAGAGYAYYRGYGWPTQESVVQGFFQTTANGGDVSQYVASSVSSDDREQMRRLLPTSGSSVEIKGQDQSMQSSTMIVSVKLPAGGEQQYKVELKRDGIGWKISDISTVYASQGSDSPSISDAPSAQGGAQAGTISSNGTSDDGGSGNGND